MLDMQAYSESVAVGSLQVREAEKIKTPRVMLFLSSGRTYGNKTAAEDFLFNRLKEDNQAVDILEARGRLDKGYGKFLKRFLRAIPGNDIVHLYIGSFDNFLKEVLPLIILARFFGRKIVLSYVSSETEFFLDKWAKLYRPIISQADRIIVPSEYTSTIFARYGYRVEILPRAIDTRRFRFKLRSSLQPKILVNRSLELKNNIPCALKAFKLVKQKYPRAEMIIAGQGSLEAALHDLVKDERISGVTFTGRVIAEDIPALYDTADLFLNSSTLDDFPLSLVEAMASGLPIVTTDAGGIPEMVTDRRDALMVPINDPVALADRIIELIENCTLVEKLSKTAGHTAARFDWQSYRNSLAELYNSLSVA